MTDTEIIVIFPISISETMNVGYRPTQYPSRIRVAVKGIYNHILRLFQLLVSCGSTQHEPIFRVKRLNWVAVGILNETVRVSRIRKPIIYCMPMLW